MFVDTNVLVKSRILEAPDHDIARARLGRTLQDPEPLRVSRQIVREYLAVVTRPETWPVAITRADALNDVDRLISAFEMLEDGPTVTDSLVALCREVPVGGRQAELVGSRGAALPADFRRDVRSAHRGSRGAAEARADSENEARVAAEGRLRELEAELERRQGLDSE